MTIEQFRKQINNIKTVKDLDEILKFYNYTGPISKLSFASRVITRGGFLIGINPEQNIIFVTLRGEIVLFNYSQETLSKESIDYILDTVLKLNSGDEFYKLYFRAYGYDIPENVSENVKAAFDYFKEKVAVIQSICVSEKYNSVTIAGSKWTNHCDIEYRISNCTKQEILDIISITHIQPAINRNNNVDFYDQPYSGRHPISERDIMDSYNDYKDSLAYE